MLGAVAAAAEAHPVAVGVGLGDQRLALPACGRC